MTKEKLGDDPEVRVDIVTEQDDAYTQGVFIEMGAMPGNKGRYIFVGNFQRGEKIETRNRLRGMSSATARELAEKLIEMANDMYEGERNE